MRGGEFIYRMSMFVSYPTDRTHLISQRARVQLLSPLLVPPPRRRVRWSLALMLEDAALSAPCSDMREYSAPLGRGRRVARRARGRCAAVVYMDEERRRRRQLEVPGIEREWC